MLAKSLADNADYTDFIIIFLRNLRNQRANKKTQSARSKKTIVMAKLKNINSHFVESDYENVLVAFLEMKK